MASQRLQRYMSVMQAKGLEPDALTMAKMIREDAAAGRPHVSASALVEEPTATPSVSLKEKRRQLINRGVSPPGETGDVSGDPASPVSLGETIGAELGAGAVAGLGVKGGIKGALAAVMAPEGFSPVTAAMKGATSSLTAPMSLAFAVNKISGSSISGGIIGANVAEAFGEEAASEAASVMKGEAELSSISAKGQNAYANAKVAMENAPKTLTKHIANLIRGKSISKAPISTVTPHHTKEAISEAFGDPGFGFGSEAFGSTMSGLHSAIDAMHSAVDAAGADGDSGGNIGAGGGDLGIGAGNF